MTRTFYSQIGALLAVIFWGISFVATKRVLHEIAPIDLIFFRFGIGTILLFAILGHRKNLSPPPRELWPMLVCMGFVGIFFHQLLQVYGLTTTSATHAGWLIGLIPIWSAVLSAVFLKERFGGIKIAGLVIGFFGALLVVSQGHLSIEFFRLPSSRGDFLILISAVNWAVYTILGHSVIRRLGAVRATAWVMLIGWLMLLPFFLPSVHSGMFEKLTLQGWGALLFLGIACSGLGYFFWYGALERIEASKVAAYLYIEPLVTLAAAYFLLYEEIQAVAVVGGLLVLAGVFLVQRAPASNGQINS